MTTVYNPTTTTIVNRIGRQFVLEDQDTLYLQRLAGRGYQIGNLRRFRDLTPGARTIIDVGANIGNNSIEYATWAKNVKSFEPTPWVRSWFAENLKHNQKHWGTQDGWYRLEDGEWASLELTGQVEIFPYALSDSQETREMFSHPRNAGHNHLVPQGDQQLTRQGWRKRREPRVEKIKYQVEVRTLDSFQFEQVDGIKIDVEGWELPVIRGARNTIDRDRPIIQTEIVEKQCLRAGYTSQELCDYMTQMGYVQTLNDGTVLTGEWQPVAKKMDRFWIPQEKI